MPMLLLPFGEPSGRGGYWSQRRAVWAVAALAGAALLAAAVAAPLVLEGLFPGAAYRGRPVLDTFGFFQALLAFWLVLGMLAFALLWRVPIAEALAAAAAVIGGIALGLLPLYAFRETAVVATVINPLESPYVMVSGQGTECGPAGCGLPFALLFHSLWEMAQHHS